MKIRVCDYCRKTPALPIALQTGTSPDGAGGISGDYYRVDLCHGCMAEVFKTIASQVETSLMSKIVTGFPRPKPDEV